MTTGKTSARAKLPPRSITSICARLAGNKRVRRKLPGWGRLHIDRQLPFLFVYRRPADREDPGTYRLLLGQASYMTTSWDVVDRKSLKELVRSVAAALTPQFGAFLIVEVWSEALPRISGASENDGSRPAFRIVTREDEELTPAVSRLERSLNRLKVSRRTPVVERTVARTVAPPGFRPLLTQRDIAGLNVKLVGVGVNPIYQGGSNGQHYPIVLRKLHRGLTRAFEQGVYEFVRVNTTHRPPHYRTLGRYALVKAVWDADRKLAQVSDAFDFLLQVTPVNGERAWRAFAKARYEKAPRFSYRPLPEDPVLLKRALYKVPVERIEDPSIQELFLQKQEELDRKLTMLADRGTRRFMYGSCQLFGVPGEALLSAAREMLERGVEVGNGSDDTASLTAPEFAQKAEAEVRIYREAYKGFAAKVEVREDVSGLLCSRGSLLIGSQSRVPLPRADAAIQHEVGTHLLTYFNGKAQPFRQLYSGLAGYEELQEGLAVLSEYAADGLTAARLRTLAARVISAAAMVDQATFVDVFRLLTDTHGFGAQSAFGITMRIFRGGGLTKDIVYLRGLLNLVDHLQDGGDVEPLLIGKVALVHGPVIRELLWRKVLQPQPLMPLWLHREQTAARLAALRKTKNVPATLLGV